MRMREASARLSESASQAAEGQASEGKGRKALLIAFALASEWALAFAFAKRFANAVAVANANALADEDADAFENIHELRHRVAALEADHGREWSAVDEDWRPIPTSVDATRECPIDVEYSQVGSTTLE